jgi:hypothetical protein
MPGDREYHIDDETRAALQTKPGVQFLLRHKLKAESRHSSDVIPWAQNLSEKLTKAVAEAAGHKLTHFAIHLNVIKLLSRHALICYDLFLHESDKDSRSQFSQNPNQPIHEIIKRANRYHIIRSKRLDDMVTGAYKHLQECDEGPRPYFEDTLYAALYVDGKRIERPKDGSRHPDEPEGWDWERGLVLGPELEDALKEREEQ